MHDAVGNHPDPDGQTLRTITAIPYDAAYRPEAPDVSSGEMRHQLTFSHLQEADVQPPKLDLAAMSEDAFTCAARIFR